MAALKNARHEIFAQGVAKGLSASEAYVAAGYKESRSAASRLSTNVNVVARVAELANRIAEKAEWSAAYRLAALKRISDAAEAEDPRVAVSAIAEANKMQGSHAPAKTELTGKDGGPIETKDTTAEALIDEAKRLGIDPSVILGEGGRAPKT